MIPATHCSEWIGQPHDAPARRVVSLVPSLTDAVCRLGAGSQLVGRTEYCVHPAGELESVPTVGGTKNSDVGEILGLRPDVVLASREENVQRRIMALADEVPVWLADPSGPEDSVPLWHALGAVVGRATLARQLATEVETALAETASNAAPVGHRYYIWKDPWMAAGPDTYISRLLAHVGLMTVVPSLQRRYPAVGDDPLADSCLHLLSTEPYEFTLPDDLKPHAAELTSSIAWRLEHGALAVMVDGRRLSWYPSCTAEGLRYAAKLAAAARGDGSWPDVEPPG